MQIDRYDTAAEEGIRVNNNNNKKEEEQQTALKRQ